MHLPTSFLCFIANNNCSIFRPEHQMILIFVSRMGSMNSICSWVCKQEGPWGHGWACVVMVWRCQLLMAAAWILPATQGLAPVQLYHWPTCPDNLKVPHVSSWIIGLSNVFWILTILNTASDPSIRTYIYTYCAITVWIEIIYVTYSINGWIA